MLKNILLFSVSFFIGIMVATILAGCSSPPIRNPKCQIKQIKIGLPPDIYEVEVCNAEIGE